MTSALLTAGQLKAVLLCVRPAVERVVVGVRPGQDVFKVPQTVRAHFQMGPL